MRVSCYNIFRSYALIQKTEKEVVPVTSGDKQQHENFCQIAHIALGFVDVGDDRGCL